MYKSAPNGKPANNNLEHKTFDIEIKSKGLPDADGYYRFEAYGSTFGNIDLYDDVIVAGAFAETLQKEIPVILWQHDRDEPIGMPEFIGEDEKGLKLNIIMPGDDDFVKGRVMPQLRIGSIKAMSIGFQTIDYYIKDGIRYITKARLREVSLVTFPANEQAMITVVKAEASVLPFVARCTPWNEEEATARVLAAGLTPIYLLKNQYALTDIVAGKQCLIPRALFIAKTTALNSLQDSEKAVINSVIESYLGRLNQEHPLTMIDVIALQKMDKRTLEQSLRDSGAFSKDAAVLVASCFNAGEPPADEAILKACQDILGNTTKSTSLSEADLLLKLEQINNQ